MKDHEGRAGVTRWLFAVVCGVAALVVGGGVAGCAARLGEDPEDLALGVAVAAYARDAGVLAGHAAPSLSQTIGPDAADVQQAALSRLDEENLPEGRLRTEGVQQVPAPLLPPSIGFYDVFATDPEGRDVNVTVVISGTEDDDEYEYCAVTVRPAGTNVYDDDAVFVLGGDDTCGS